MKIFKILLMMLFATISTNQLFGQDLSINKNRYNLDTKTTQIYDVKNNTAKINIGNLTIGQSGIIIHKSIKNDLILANAVVIQSDQKIATIKFLDTASLKQDAIPTTNFKPANDDSFILNHLCKASISIIPNASTRKLVHTLYPSVSFISEDLFASYLKINNTPLPTKKDIQEFAKDQQLGTIFFVIDNNLYIVDTQSFKIIYNSKLKLNDKTIKVPFYSNIKDIETNFWNFGASKIENYNDYYKEILGLKEQK